MREEEKPKPQSGFTLMEVIVTIAIFAVLLTAVIGTFGALSRASLEANEKTAISSLATNYLEIVRNMPYSQVGTLEGNPHGNLPDQDDAFTQFINGNKYNIFYKVTYVHDPADSATGTPDYKQVKMSILNSTTNQNTDFLTTVVPQGLISNPNTGALQVNVINSQGQPLSGASVNITYPTSSPYTYDLPDTSNGSGQVTEVGLPRAVNDYRIVATKTGYSTDQTYPITAQNPNPVHPDATVATGTITQLTLSIDQLANLNIKTLDSTCHALSGVNFNVAGAKLIGTPNVLKFNNNYSSAGGSITLNNIEWDTYTPTLLTGQSVIVYGTSPIQAITVLPGTTQTYTAILGSNSTPYSILVIVKDASSGSALEGSAVTLSQGGSTVASGITGGSVWLQNDWSGGAGQAQYSSSTSNRYYADNGSIDASNPGTVKLKKLGGNYTTATGTVESSTFDTGTGVTNYTILSWQPLSQSASTTLEFQVAANNNNATWNYVGPDGTAGTYFTTPGTDMGSALDNNEYFRYKAFLSTQDPTKTPVLSSVAANFVTGCFTPGQVIFTGLNNSSYDLSVSLAGYSTQNISGLTPSGNQAQAVLMSP